MQNHGLVALGRSAQETEDVTMLMNSVARLRIESHALGGPHALSLAQVDGIHTAQTTTFAASNGDERS